MGGGEGKLENENENLGLMDGLGGDICFLSDFINE
jgi:hypothetical protein